MHYSRFGMCLFVACAFLATACDNSPAVPSIDAGTDTAIDSGGCSGTTGCACSATATCNSGLVCDSALHLCRPATSCSDAGCVANQRCDALPNNGGYACVSGMCEPGFSFNGTSHACEAIAGANCTDGDPFSILAECTALQRGCSVNGVGASCTSCLPGYVASGSSCRAAANCTEANCGAVNKTCTTLPAGVSCGACLPGYGMVNGNCVSASQCNACTTAHRVCTGAPGNPCGQCDNGYVDDGSGTCISASSCTGLTCAGPTASCVATPSPHCVCGAGHIWDSVAASCRAVLDCATSPCGTRVCIAATASADRICADACPSGSGWDPIGLSCRACFVPNCGGSNPGETGFVLSTVAGMACECETVDGYYYGDANDAVSCDVDRDGWVTDAAFEDLHSMNVATQANARCHVRVVDHVDLVPDAERGAPGVTSSQTIADLELFESDRNDGGGALVPRYGEDVASNNRLLAEQLNSLTKACAYGSGDYNDNKIPDVSESQLDAASGVRMALVTLYTRYTSLSYFLELHEGSFVPSAVGSLRGRYRIAERPRLGSGGVRSIPVAWPVAAQDYGQTCARSTDILYVTGGGNTVDSLTGGDFTNLNVGMNHHSEFKCIAVTTEGAYSTNADDRPYMVYDGNSTSSTFYRKTKATMAQETLSWRPVMCSYDGSSQYDIESGATGVPAANRTNPQLPLLTCAPAPVTSDYSELDQRVMWAVVGYDGYTISPTNTYRHGCIDECETFGVQACPGYGGAGSMPEGFSCDEVTVANFGKLSCGCTNRFASGTSGVAECDVACDAAEVHEPIGGIDFVTRSGPWMCGGVELSTSLYTVDGATNRTTFLGYVPSSSVAGLPMTAAPAGGPTIRLTAR